MHCKEAVEAGIMCVIMMIQERERDELLLHVFMPHKSGAQRQCDFHCEPLGEKLTDCKTLWTK